MKISSATLIVLLGVAGQFYFKNVHGSECNETLSRTELPILAPQELKELLARSNFEVRRALTDYDRALFNYTDDKNLSDANENYFSDRLKKLPSGSILLDAGSGNGMALRDILTNDEYSHLAQVLSITFKPSDRLYKLEHFEQFKLFGGLLEDVVKSEEFQPYVGKVDVISDVYGPVTYSPNIAETINTYFRLLEVNGHIELSFATMTSAIKGRLIPALAYLELFRPNQQTPPLIETFEGNRLKNRTEHEEHLTRLTKHVIERQITTELNINAWLQSGTGYVIEAIKSHRITHNVIHVILRKTDDVAYVPPLKLLEFKDDAPTYRRYLWEGVDRSNGKILYRFHDI